MKDNMYEFLNNMKIDEPNDLMKVSQEEKDRIKDAIGGKIMKPKKSKKFLKTISIAAALVLGFLTFTGPGQVIYGNMVDFYRQLVDPIESSALNSKGVKEGITQVNKSVKDHGIEMKVEEALLDEDVIYMDIYYKVIGEKIEKEFDEESNLIISPMETELLVNGKKVFTNQGTVSGNIVNNRTVQQYCFFKPYEKVKDGDKITLKVSEMNVLDYNKISRKPMKPLVQEILTDNEIDIQGDWTLEFTIKDGTPYMETAKVDLSPKQILFKGETLHLDSFRLNPYRSTISLHYEESARNIATNMMFIAKDSKGIEYRFETGFEGSTTEQKEASYQYVKEDGKDLLAQDTLTIQGYYDQSNSPDQKDYTPIGEPFTITIK